MSTATSFANKSFISDLFLSDIVAVSTSGFRFELFDKRIQLHITREQHSFHSCHGHTHRRRNLVMGTRIRCTEGVSRREFTDRDIRKGGDTAKVYTFIQTRGGARYERLVIFQGSSTGARQIL